MKKQARILIVEDIASDVELAKNEICRIVADCEFQVVETYEGFLRAIETFNPDVIISDYTLPHFDGLKALALTQKHAQLVPFIMWSGSISENLAVECIRSGANNSIFKDNLQQLGPAVLHALEERELIVARKQAEEKYQSIFEYSMEGIFQSSPKGYFLNVNPAMAQIYGYASPKEMLESITNIATQIYIEQDKRSEFARLLDAKDSIENFEARNYCKDGSIIWTSTSARGVRHQNGNILYYEGFVQDITQRKRAEEALQNNEKRFRLLIQNGLDSISLLAADGTLLWESPASNRTLNYAPNEHIGHNIFLELMHPDDLEWTRQVYAKVLQEPGGRQHGTFRLRHADGTWHWVEAIITNLLDEPGINAIVANYRDSTEQKQAEIELQQKNTDLTLINSLNELVNRGETLDAMVDRLRNEVKSIFSSEYTNIYLLNQGGQSIKLHRYSIPPEVAKKIEQVIGRAIPAIEIPVQEDGLFQRVLRSGRGIVINNQEVLQKWIGEFVETASLPTLAKAAIRKLLPQIYKILNIKSTVLVPLISDGKPIGLLNVAGSNILTEQDLRRIENIGGQLTTALQRAKVEEVLNDERNLLRTLIDNLPDRIYAMDMQGRKTLSNTADWLASGGKTMEDVIGKTDFDTYPPELAEEFWQLDKAVLESGRPVFNYEEPGLDADGNRVSVLTSKIPLRDEAGEVIGLVGIGRDITERKQTEERINDLLAFNEKILNHSSIGILTYKFTGECVFANEIAASIVGTSVETLKAQNFHAIASWKQSGLYELVTKAISTHAGVVDDIHHFSTFGKDVWMTAHCVTFKSKEEDHLLLSITDITERKRIEQALQESQDKLEFAQRIAHVGHFEHNLDTNGITLSDEIYRILGLEPQANLILSNGMEQIHPDDRVKVSQALADCIRTGQPFKVEYRIVRPDGQERFIHSEGGLILDDSNHPSRVFGIAQDITERQQAEVQLRYSENRYRLVTQATNDIIWEWNPETHQLFWSENAQHVFGYSEIEIGPDETWWDNHIHPDDRERVLTKLNELIEGKESIWMEEYRFLLKDGSYAYISDRAYIERDANGSPLRMIGAMANITNRKQAEEKLRQSQTRYRALVETQTDFIVRWQPDGTRTFANEAYRKYFGLAFEQALTANFVHLIHEEDRQSVENKVQHLISGETNVETDIHRVIKPDGSIGWQEWTDQAIRDNHGQLIELQSVGRDITERKRSETERQALLEIMQGLANTKDLQELLNLVHHSIAKVIYAENFFVVLHHANTGLFEEIYSVDQYDPPEPPSKLENSITSYVFRSGNPLLLTQGLFDELETQGEVKLIGTNSASWLGVPLKTSGRTIGVMAVQDYENDNRYADREKDFLSSIATQVAVVIERKQAEEALRESEEHYRTIFEGVQDAIFVESLDGKILMVNERACEMFGHTQEEFLTKTVADLVPPGYWILTAGETGESLSAEPRETVNQRANGEVFPIEISGRLQVINAEEVLLVVVRDITERKQAEEGLKRSTSLLHATLESTADGILVVGPDGKISNLNRKFLELWQIPDHLAGHMDDRLLLDFVLNQLKDPSAFISGVEALYQSPEATSFDELEFHDGRVFERFSQPQRLGDTIVGRVWSFRDVTERKQAEAAEREQRILAEALRATAETLNSTLDYGEVLDQILTAVGRVVPHDAATIMLIEGDTARVVRSQGYDKYDFNAQIMGIRLPLAETLNLKQIVERRQPVVIYDTHTYSGWKRMPATDWLRSSVGAPISIYGEVIGFICLDGQPPEFFSPVHAERLEAFANQAAIAMYNAQLLQQAQEEIAERKRAEESLRAERRKAEKYLEIAGVMMLALDREGTVTLINQKGCEILGYPADQIVGKNWIDTFLPEATRPELHDVFQKLISDDIQAASYYENSVLTKSGEERLVAWHNTLLRDEQGIIISTLSSGEDITERKRAEAALLESTTRFQTLFEASPDAIVLLDPAENWSIIDCNSAACQMNGYTREELLGQCIDILNVTPGNQDERTGYLERIKQHGVLHYETSHRHKDGTILTVDVSTSLIKFDTRDLILGIDRDITERKRADAEMHRRAEETSALLGTSLALTNLDLEATLQTVGNSANTLFLADGCRIFLTEPDGETLRCVLALGENTSAFSDLRIKIGQGVTGAVAASGMPEIVNEMQYDPRAVQVSGTDEEQEAIMFAPLKERDRTIGILSVRRVGENRCFQLSDLGLLEAFASMAASAVSNARLFEETQRRLAELHASEERFRQLADNIQEAFWMTDAEDGREIYMSPAVETIWGRSVESLMYEPGAFLNSILPEDRPAALDAIEKEKNGEKKQLEYRILRPDGTIRWIWDRAFPIFDESGQVKRIAGISADITERKDAAEKLSESEDRYHSLFQSQLHGSALHEIITNDQGKPEDYIFLKVNPAFEKMTGLKAQDLVGRRVTEVLPGIENERLIQIYGQVALTGEPAHLNEYVAPLGRYYEINAYSTGPRRFAVSFMDVTDRRQAEQELRKLSRAVEQTGSTIVITDTSGSIEYVNPKFTQITGYSVEEVIGQNPRILKSGFTSDEEYKQLWQTISSSKEWHGELLNKKKNGELFWESVTISPILNDHREITHFVGVKEDITERKQSEIETRRHIAELEAVYENGLSVGRLLEPGEIGNRVIETFSRYLPWHHVTIRLKKEESDELELVAFNLPNLKEEERTDAEQHFIARINKVGQGLSGWVMQTGTPLRTGNVHAHPQYIDTHAGIQSGLYMPLKVGERVIGVISVESEASNAFTEQDERLLATLANQTAVAFENARLYAVMQKELSERKRVEDALRVSETHYRALADSITDILFELDQDLHYTHWNKASEALTGFPAEDAIGKSMEEIFGTNEEQARIKTIYGDVLRRHQPRTFETILVFNGEKRSFETTAYPSLRGVSVVAKDVTDRKRSETIMQKRFELMEYSAKHSLNELMRRTVDEVSELTGSTIGFFHFMEEDQIHLEMQTWSTSAVELFHVSTEDGEHLPLDQAGVWAEAVRQRRPLIQNDYESLAKKKGIPPGHVPIIREIVIPIIRNERIMAVMGIGNKPQDYRSHDLEIAARLADYAWDITERKQMEIALEIERNQLVERVEERTADLSRANSNLARALRVKDEFLANMSHELRTPLNAILGLSESLGEQIAGPLNEKQQKYISTISESGHHLLSLINDILDLAKIDAGHITLDINKMDIRSVCHASLRMIKQLAQRKNQDVSLEIDDGLGLMWADERRLKQMIVNLLGNAVKFTPENGKLGLEVHGDEEANQVAITVWDNGIGIKDDDLARLFQPFVQLDSGLAREATGTGLGLALVAQMARLHGGSVTVVSDADKGSRFTIVLPWEPALAIDTASRMRITGKFRAIQFDDTNKPTILLVEDTKEVVMMLKDYLELAGYKVFTAQDGIDGIVQARHVKPDLILMDVQMPRMDGFETTRKLRSDPNFRYTPIIALTALAMPHDRERCLEAGMDEYISKPVNLKALVKIIQSCLFEKDSHTR